MDKQYLVHKVRRLLRRNTYEVRYGDNTFIVMPNEALANDAVEALTEAHNTGGNEADYIHKHGTGEGCGTIIERIKERLDQLITQKDFEDRQNQGNQEAVDLGDPPTKVPTEFPPNDRITNLGRVGKLADPDYPPAQTHYQVEGDITVDPIPKPSMVERIRARFTKNQAEVFEKHYDPMPDHPVPGFTSGEGHRVEGGTNDIHLSPVGRNRTLDLSAPPTDNRILAPMGMDTPQPGEYHDHITMSLDPQPDDKPTRHSKDEYRREDYLGLEESGQTPTPGTTDIPEPTPTYLMYNGRPVLTTRQKIGVAVAATIIVGLVVLIAVSI